MEATRQRWEALQQTIADAAARAGRSPSGIAVVAVTKTRPPEQIDAVIGCGLTLLGENRVQEAEAKRPQVRGQAHWHLIGHLQTNKARRAATLFDVVQSVDSQRLACSLEQHAAEVGRRLDVLLQVNTSGAPQQSGLAPEAAQELAAEVAGMPHLHLRGLMTIAELSQEEGPVRSCFALLRRTRDQLVAARLSGVELDILSMGMSSDFQWAIAEGSTMLRLGTALFGPRSAAQ